MYAICTYPGMIPHPNDLVDVNVGNVGLYTTNRREQWEAVNILVMSDHNANATPIHQYCSVENR